MNILLLNLQNEKQDSLELTDYATNLSGEESGFENPLYGAEKKVNYKNNETLQLF